MQNPKIKNLLFDLGGVIVDIERDNCVEAFARLGLPDAESYFGLYAQSGIFMGIEDGSVSVDEFHSHLRENCLTAPATAKSTRHSRSS